MRRLLPAAIVAVVAAIAVFAGSAMADGDAESSAPLGPGVATVHLTIRHSRFSLERIEVQPGTTVRFVVDNADPIGHELIIGDAGVHLRHENGTEPTHAPRPGEVSIAGLSTAETTFTFAQPGPMLFACHLPGHLAYGMSGTVDVVPR